MSGVADSPQRREALNPLRSFCVAAPAGSGKTELLIQRYLALLARVVRPEQVLAITFTRKAAAEMRERVIEALQAAAHDVPIEGEHQEVTRELARAVLVRDEASDWHLGRDHSRFNIKTIDSFCAGLSRQMPVLSGLGGRAGGQDDATQYYAEAVMELFAHLDNQGPAAVDLAEIMRQFDNNWARLQELLVAMLWRREQWQSYIGVSQDPRASEAYLVEAVEAVLGAELGILEEALTPHAPELLELLRYAASNLEQEEPDAFPGTSPSDIETWRALRNLLLTRQGKWRAKIDKRSGFPAGKGEAADWKERWQTQRLALEDLEGLEGRLDMVSLLPVMATGSDNWQLVIHLSRLLPLLAAELLLVFQRHGVVDHIQVAQSALLALGEDDAVTDLALRLDYSIEHILVDEFQDTAVTQYDLLRKLTRGWQEHNNENPQAPRTLMIVGDPMQSIYGFRGANVGLFLLAREEGFNGVVPEYLQLQSNFRSDAGITEWVNEVFTGAFPDTDNPHLAQVKYSPAIPVRAADLEVAVNCHGFYGENALQAEVALVCDYLEEHANSDETLAVLGRSRSHLQPVIDELKLRGIAHNAQDLDSLASSSVVADLLVLSRALSSDADRLAWMALLRTPWFALSLADLLVIATYPEHARYQPVWQCMMAPECQARLSEEGRWRLQHLLPVLVRAREKRYRLGLRVLVEQLWTDLGGPEAVAHSGGLDDAEHFMQLLEQAEAEGIGLDADWLQTRLEKQFMSGGDPQAAVQLMTLHKAKGLEFSRVVIPQLGRQTRGNDRDILRWEEHADASGQRHFLLAADDGSKAGEPGLYNYLGHLHREKELRESTRLLYVGTTRAQRHLLLTTGLKWDERNGQPGEPAQRSLLHAIWPSFSRQMTVQEAVGEELATQGDHSRPLYRLVRERVEPATVSSNAGAERENPPDHADNHRERSIGTVVHLALEKLSERSEVPEKPTDADRALWRLVLQEHGLFGEALESALEEVTISVTTTLHSEEGRWVLSGEHSNTHNEWALSTVGEDGVVQDIIVDRTFIDAQTGVRWIVDYKNSRPADGESLEAFYTREEEKYRAQLQGYRNALNAMGDTEIACALFFTALGTLHALGAALTPLEER